MTNWDTLPIIDLINGKMGNHLSCQVKWFMEMSCMIDFQIDITIEISWDILNDVSSDFLRDMNFINEFSTVSYRFPSKLLD